MTDAIMVLILEDGPVVAVVDGPWIAAGNAHGEVNVDQELLGQIEEALEKDKGGK